MTLLEVLSRPMPFGVSVRFSQPSGRSLEVEVRDLRLNRAHAFAHPLRTLERMAPEMADQYVAETVDRLLGKAEEEAAKRGAEGT